MSTTTTTNPFTAATATTVAPIIAMLEEMEKQVERWTEYGQAQLAETIKVSRALRQQQMAAAKAMLESMQKASQGAMDIAQSFGAPRAA